MDKEFGSQDSEQETYTFGDVVKFLEDDLAQIKTEEGTGEIELTSKIKLPEQVAMRMKAIEALKHNDVRPACEFLDWLIDITQGMAEGNPGRGYEKRLEQLKKIRSAID